MWWLACCLGYCLLQKFRPTRLISDAKVVHRLARSFQSTHFPQGRPEGTLEWFQRQIKPSPSLQQGGALPFFRQPSSTSKEPPLKNCPPLTFHTLENVTHLFTFLTCLIIASLPACHLFWLSLCFSGQPWNLRTPPANHSHSKALHWQSHTEGSWTLQWSLNPMKSRMAKFILREELNELSHIPHCSPRAHSPNPAHPHPLIATTALDLAVNDSAWIHKMYGLWWEGRPFRPYFVYFSCQEKKWIGESTVLV